MSVKAEFMYSEYARPFIEASHKFPVNYITGRVPRVPRLTVGVFCFCMTCAAVSFAAGGI